ncbi:MAG: hypothetical protein Q4G39_05915 [Brachymonas sp.]|nr:hypothetical protein [Brachymonas sp.]
MKRIGFSALLVAAASLAACGGGGSGSNTPPAKPVLQSQGAWIGTTYAGLITPDGEGWIVPLQNDGSVTKIAVKESANTVSGSGHYYEGLMVSSVSSQGNFEAKKSITVTTTAQNGSKETVTAQYDAVYDGTPSLAAIAGNYTGVNGGNYTMLADGSVTGTTGYGCSVSGKATLDKSGKNFYRVTLTEGAAPCPYPGLALPGVFVLKGTQVIGAVAAVGKVGESFVLNKQ